MWLEVRPRNLAGGRLEEERQPLAWLLRFIPGIGNRALLLGHGGTALPRPIHHRGIIGDNLFFLVGLVTRQTLVRKLHFDPIFNRHDGRVALPIGLAFVDNLKGLAEPIQRLADELVRGNAGFHAALSVGQFAKIRHDIVMHVAFLHCVVDTPVAPHAGHVVVRHMAMEQEVPRQLLAQAGSAFRIEIEGFGRPDHLHVHPIRFGPDDRIFDRPVFRGKPERHFIAGARTAQPADRAAVRMVGMEDL